jgi:hypothetical protein
MQLITTSAGLKKAIQQLELQQAEEWPLLKEEFLKTVESLKPINIIKNTLKEAVDLPDLKTDIINSTIGLTTGIIAKKLIIGKTLNPLSKLLGVALEMFVANKVSKNTGEIKSLGNSIIKKIFYREPELEKHDG